jgi:hypothetical protein
MTPANPGRRVMRGATALVAVVFGLVTLLAD